MRNSYHVEKIKLKINTKIVATNDIASRCLNGHACNDDVHAIYKKKLTAWKSKKISNIRHFSLNLQITRPYSQAP